MTASAGLEGMEWGTATVRFRIAVPAGSDATAVSEKLLAMIDGAKLSGAFFDWQATTSEPKRKVQRRRKP